jgi:hypothetical protein
MKKLSGVVLGMAVGLVWSFAAAAQCPELSKVEWWTNTVPEVRLVVQTSYQGSWESYITRWRRHRSELKLEYDSGRSVEIKSRGLVFQDQTLKNYIAQVEERIATLECLANAEIATFNTAAGGAQGPMVQEAKLVEGQELSVEISPICKDGVAAFQVTNLGERWPRVADITVYRTDTKDVISQRRVRMANSQQMLLKAPGAGEVGIFIEPTWYTRAFDYDARTRC